MERVSPMRGVVVDGEFAGALGALGLDSIDGVFADRDKGYLRTHANRDNFHIVESVDGRAYDFYMKRHWGFEIKEFLKFLATTEPFVSAGRREWENSLKLEAMGIPTVRAVAYGERKMLGIELKSFVITETIPGAVELNRYIKERCEKGFSKEAMRERRSLMWELGGIMRRLHHSGLTHMDLYLNHFLVREREDGDKVLHLIDLQRVAKRWFWRRRWVVKDLAALLYSTRNLPLSKTDMGRVFAEYFDVSHSRLSRADRELLRAALRRADRMAAQAAK